VIPGSWAVFRTEPPPCHPERSAAKPKDPQSVQDVTIVGEIGRLPLPTSISTVGGITMKSWSRPDFEEVTLGCEINCYAPAEA
jgi:coenzyme PQQ precursor peptide PqqA